VDVGPTTRPVPFRPDLVPPGMLLHGGTFSPDLEVFLFTLSDARFERFDVKCIRKLDGAWSEPEDAFFNSSYDEHGASFSPDGATVYFSSTRPVPIPGVADTWHLWRCDRIGAHWSEPAFIDIPNLRHRLVSHASVARDGTLYFHAGSPDYSLLDIYSATPSAAGYEDAVKLDPAVNRDSLQCTPYIDPEQRYLLFESSEGLRCSVRNADGSWGVASALGEASPEKVRGNPYVTPDGRFLFFAAGDDPRPGSKPRWLLYWSSTERLALPGEESPPSPPVE